MTGENAFRQAILDNPDDDGARLLYADWLEERGDPAAAARAEFIRVQFALRDLREDDPRRPQLRERERDLLLAYQAEWTRPLAPLVKRWEFRRGFVEKVSLTPAAFDERAATLFELAPIREVRFNDGGTRRGLYAVLDHSSLGRLAGVDLEEANLDGEQMAAFCASPHLSALRTLRVRRRSLAAPGLAALLRAPWLDRLTELHVRGNFSDASLVPLWLSPSLAELSVLVSTSWLTLAQANTGAVRAELRALVDSPHLNRLTTLGLPESNLRPESLRILGAARGLLRLRRLDLSNNALDYTAGAVLANAPLLDRLEALDLRINQLGDEGVLALADSPHLGRLAVLDLSANAVGPGGARALASSQRLGRLASLGLRTNRLRDAGLARLAGALGLPRLTSLNVAYNDIGPVGVRVLAAAPPGALAALDLSWNPVGDEGAAALAASPRLAALAALDLGYARLGDEAAERLAASPHLRSLVGLNMSTNRVGDRGVWALAQTWELPRLIALNLGYNNVGAEGVRALAKSPLLGRLTALNLAGNGLTPESLEELRRRLRGCLIA